MTHRAAAPRAGVLAFLIADIRGYTSFTRTHGDEAAARLAAAFAGLCREAVEAHDGTVIELRGDEALATFASPRQALRAATQLQVVLADEQSLYPDLPLNVGIGVDVGEAVAVEGGYRGDALNFAARLCSAAAAGEILVSEAVSRLAGEMGGIVVEHVDGLSLKGLGADVKASRIHGVRPATLAVASTAAVLPVELDPLTPMYGRDQEARSMRWAWREARRGDGRAVVVTGPTGIGKTRLAAEVGAVAARDGASVTYASAFGSSLPAALDRLASSRGPALLVVDDLESATDEDLSAVRAAAKAQPARSLLVAIATDEARPDVAASIRSLAASGRELPLGPISDDAVAQIVAGYAKDADDPPPLWAIAQASGGKPAQIHELAATWSRQQVTQRLGIAAARTADGRRDLRQLESEVANNVIDLQLAQARLNLVGRTSHQSEDVCPYKGLVAFDVADANLFYGRERLVAEMVGRLAGASFMAVVGPSGSGKSSAVRAGLLPALMTGALPGSDQWRAIVVRPGAHPMRELDRVLYASISTEQREQLSRAGAMTTKPTRPEATASQDQSESRGAATDDDPLASVAALLSETERLLLVVDQFEEVFTLADASERDAFVNVIERAAATGATTVVLALRADFYGRCAAYPTLAGLLGGGHILVGAMSSAEYARAIEGPARRAGLTIDPALVDALVLDVIDQPGALPLLSTALVELWEKREGRAIRLSAYAATGGVRGAVGRLAEAAFGAFDKDEQTIARGLFLRLSAGDGDAVVRRRVPLPELDVGSSPRVAGVVKMLTEARLVTVGDGSLEVAHEALLREWPRLAAWLDEDRAGRRLREHLVTAAREWDAADHDPGELYRGTRLGAAIDWTTDHTLELTETERAFLAESRAAAAHEVDRQRQTNRRLRAFLAVAGVALVVALGAGAFAFVQGQTAARSATVADAQRLGAQALIESNLDVSLLLARQGVAFDDDTVTRADLLSAIVRSPAAIGAWRPVPGRPLSVSVSPDGRNLLVMNNDQNVFLIDSATGQVVRDMGPGWMAWFASDGSIVQASGSGSLGTSMLAIAGVDEAAAHLTIPLNSSFALSPDTRTLSELDDDKHGITLTDTATHAVVGHIAAPPNTIFLDVWQYGAGGVLGVVHDGIPATDADLQAAYDGPVQLEWWPAGASQPTTAIPAQGNQDGMWALDPAASEIAVPEIGDSIGIYDLPTGQRRDFTMHHSFLSGMTFTPDGSTLVTAGQDKLLQVWDAATGQLRDTLTGHAGKPFAPAISDAGGHLTAWSVGLDSQLIEWDLTGDRRIDRPLAFSGAGASEDRGDHPALAMTVSEDGRFVATTGGGGTVDVFDAHTLASVEHLQALPSGATAMALAFSPDSQTLAVSGQGDSMIATWDTSSWTNTGATWVGPSATKTVPLEAPAGTPAEPNYVATVAWSPDGRLLAGGTGEGGVYLWDTKTGAQVRNSDYCGRRLQCRVQPGLGQHRGDVPLGRPGRRQGLRVVNIRRHTALQRLR